MFSLICGILKNKQTNKQKTKLHTENRLVVARVRGLGSWGNGSSQKVKITRYKINKFWICNA